MSFSKNLRRFTRFNATSPMRDCTPCLPVSSAAPEQPNMIGKRRQALTSASDSSISHWRSIGDHWPCWPRPKLNASNLNASNPQDRDGTPARRTALPDFPKERNVSVSRASHAAERGSKRKAANESRIAPRSMAKAKARRRELKKGAPEQDPGLLESRL